MDGGKERSGTARGKTYFDTVFKKTEKRMTRSYKPNPSVQTLNI